MSSPAQKWGPVPKTFHDTLPNGNNALTEGGVLCYDPGMKRNQNQPTHQGQTIALVPTAHPASNMPFVSGPHAAGMPSLAAELHEQATPHSRVGYFDSLAAHGSDIHGAHIAASSDRSLDNALNDEDADLGHYSQAAGSRTIPRALADGSLVYGHPPVQDETKDGAHATAASTISDDPLETLAED